MIETTGVQVSNVLMKFIKLFIKKKKKKKIMANKNIVIGYSKDMETDTIAKQNKSSNGLPVHLRKNCWCTWSL